MADQALDGGPIEEIGVVSGDAVEGLVAGEREGQVKLRRAGRHGFEAHRQTRVQLSLEGDGILEHEARVDQGVAIAAALGLEILDQLLERHVLVVVGREPAVGDRGEEILEAGVTGPPEGRELGAQHQGVDEKADRSLDLGVSAARDRRGHGEVVLTGGAVEQGPGKRRAAPCRGSRRFAGRDRAPGSRAPATGRSVGCRRGCRGPAAAADRWAARGARGPPGAGATRRAAPRAPRPPATGAARRRSRHTGSADPAAATAGRRPRPRRAPPARRSESPPTSRRRRCGGGSRAARAGRPERRTRRQRKIGPRSRSKGRRASSLR